MSDTEIVEVMVFGDSITYGAWDNNGGWVQRLREPIDVKNLVNEEVAYFVYNLGVVDDTSTGIAKRFEDEMKSRRYMNAKQERIVLFNIGLNDSQILLKKKTNRVPRQTFGSNVETLIRLAKKHANKVIFVGPTPVDEKNAVPVSWDSELAYKNSEIKEYDDMLKSICKKNNVYFVEIFDEFMNMDYVSLIEDGLHLSPGGHLVVYELVRKFLEKNRIINFDPKKTIKKL